MEVDAIVRVPGARGVRLYATECNVCGTVFGIENRLDDSLRENGRLFYCPNGHGLRYKETEATRLKKQLDEEKRKLANAQFELMAAEKKMKRIENRIKNGICPCCNRQFVQLTRHMKSKHPEYAEEQNAND
jgi:hypothetical protein